MQGNIFAMRRKITVSAGFIAYIAVIVATLGLLSGFDLSAVHGMRTAFDVKNNRQRLVRASQSLTWQIVAAQQTFVLATYRRNDREAESAKEQIQEHYSHLIKQMDDMGAFYLDPREERLIADIKGKVLEWQEESQMLEAKCTRGDVAEAARIQSDLIAHLHHKIDRELQALANGA